MLKFYLDSVQYNKVAKAENRSQTKMFTEQQKAESSFYKSVGADMDNANLGGSVTILYDSEGDVRMVKKWGFMSEDEAPVEPTTEEVTE